MPFEHDQKQIIEEVRRSTRMGPLVSHMSKFFNSKSYMPKWNFIVKLSNTKTKRELNSIFSHHVVSVQIPQYKMKSQTTMYGPIPRSFPILDHESPFNITITFEEDRYGTIIRLINKLQKSVINQNGLHEFPNNSKNIDITIDLYNYENQFICQWIAPKAYFLNAQEVDLSYTTDDSMRFNIIFGSDILEFSYNEEIQQNQHRISTEISPGPNE
ncbi:MAG: hypothetical protein ACOCZ5_00190 [bacterium]